MALADKKRIKVAVAMSGGVDSSVAAALLKKQGKYDVIGVFMKFWAMPEKDNLAGSWNKCCSSESESRARKVAKILNIPFYVFNFEKEFKKQVVDHFLDGHKKGITPNPCVICNKTIKLGLFLEKSLKLGAEYVATGHYARKIKNEKCKTSSKNSYSSFTLSKLSVNDSSNLKNFKMLKGKDKNKDQSYFLWQLSQKQLKRILFPIGGYKRSEVEELAKKFKLPFSGVKKSQEVCFIPKTVEGFIKKYLKTKVGLIIDKKGKKLGQHQGLYFYTIGQRKGIGLAGGPYFVLSKDLKSNYLIITKNEKDLYKKELFVKDVNWILGKEPKLPIETNVKIRYRSKSSAAILSYDRLSKTYCLKFKKAQRAITSGQSAVFYLKDELLGGGIIL